MQKSQETDQVSPGAALCFLRSVSGPRSKKGPSDAGQVLWVEATGRERRGAENRGGQTGTQRPRGTCRASLEPSEGWGQPTRCDRPTRGTAGHNAHGSHRSRSTACSRWTDWETSWLTEHRTRRGLASAVGTPRPRLNVAVTRRANTGSRTWTDQTACNRMLTRSINRTKFKNIYPKSKIYRLNKKHPQFTKLSNRNITILTKQ